MPDHRPPALLLLGPTGSGKTPLGLLLEARGLAGRRCVHFDFLPPIFLPVVPGGSS